MSMQPPPTPSPGGGRGTGRLSSLPTGVKVGGIVLLVAGGWFLWKKRQAGAATTPTATPTQDTSGTALPGQSSLSPLLNGYQPTGQITGYDSSGNPIMGVAPKGGTVGGLAPPPGGGTWVPSGGQTMDPGPNAQSAPMPPPAWVPGSSFTPGGLSPFTGTPVPLGANPATGGVPAGADPNQPFVTQPNVQKYSLAGGGITSDPAAAYASQLAAMGLKPGGS